MQKHLIYDLTLPELESLMDELGQPRFRAKQIWTAVYQNLIDSVQEISTLSKSLRNELDERIAFSALEPVRTIDSRDKRTAKTLFKLRDGEFIEAVLMYYDERRTLCISSQSGCGMGCTFCATGQMGLRRNLTSGEVVAQVLYYARLLAENDQRVTNVVVMGMGEPFNNYENVMDALKRLNDPDGFGLGARRITLSTVGLIPEIIRFADEGTQYNLAISLHTVDDDLRSSLIPINKKYPVNDLLAACRYYVKKTNRRLTFEYALIEGVNDSTADAEALAQRIRGMQCHVNLIPLNPVKGYSMQGSSEDSVRDFNDVLEAHGIPCTVRLRRGIEIQAGCGQLAADFKTNS
jgi:23S rRNA (adenine2503-C2)-methyltransferase